MLSFSSEILSIWVAESLTHRVIPSLGWMPLGFIEFLGQEWKVHDNHLRDLNESFQLNIMGQKHIKSLLDALIPSFTYFLVLWFILTSFHSVRHTKNESKNIGVQTITLELLKDTFMLCVSPPIKCVCNIYD